MPFALKYTVGSWESSAGLRCCRLESTFSASSAAVLGALCGKKDLNRRGRGELPLSTMRNQVGLTSKTPPEVSLLSLDRRYRFDRL